MQYILKTALLISVSSEIRYRLHLILGGLRNVVPRPIVQRNGTPTLFPDLVNGLVDGNPAYPSIQGAISGKLVVINPVKRLVERFKHKVLCFFLISQVSPAECIHPYCISPIQFILRLSVLLRAVPGQCLLVQFFIHSRLCLNLQSYTDLRKRPFVSFQERYPGQFVCGSNAVAVKCLQGHFIAGDGS